MASFRDSNATFPLVEQRSEMDFWAAVQELYDEKQRLDKAIKILEDLAAGAATEPASRRGRKTMPERERLEVSERMKRYWASRRKERP